MPRYTKSLLVAALSFWSRRWLDKKMLSEKLIKKVCQKCYEKDDIIWDRVAESYWEKGWVQSVKHHASFFANVYKPVPKDCPFDLEHLMAEQEDAE